MKFPLFSIAFLLTVSSLPAQDLKLKVLSGNEPLGYAYVYINGAIFGSADSMGVTRIPQQRLHIGDTISASFVGAADNALVYDETTASAGEALLILDQNYTVDAVTVTAQDNSRCYFRRYVNPRAVWNWWQEIAGDFELEISRVDGPVQRVVGELSFSMIPSSQGYDRRSFRGLDRLVTDSDTTGIGQMTYSAVWSTLYMAAYAPILYRGAPDNRHMIIRYRGEKDGVRQFLLLRPYQSGDPENSQTLLFVDSGTKEILGAEIIRISEDKNKRIDLTVEYQIVTFPYRVLIPRRITGWHLAFGELRQQIVLSNLTMRHYSGNERKKIVGQRDRWKQENGIIPPCQVK